MSLENLEPIYNHYIIDMSSNNNFVQIPTMQGDGNNVRGFEVELISNGSQYIINKDDTIVSIIGTKPDTCQIFNDCKITDEGYILVDITSQMSAVKGRGDYSIVLMSKNTNSQLKSFPFYILTTSAPFDVDYIVSSDEFQLMTKNIVQVETVTNNANKAITDIRKLESSLSQAEDARVNAEKARASAENSRKSAESTRNSNENDRKTNETARQTAETNRENAENDRVSAESTRIANENTRIENENTRIANETARQNAETGRVDAEKNRVNAEAARVDTENTRTDNENTRKTNESARQTTEANRVNAENIRKSNESTRQDNETTRQTNESTRQTNTATAISDAEEATERANKAAEACENIVAGTGVVMQTEKGAANGVATLDENKKLSRNQIPNDVTKEIVSSTEPESGIQDVGDFWLQEY